MTEYDGLVERTVASVVRIANKVTRAATVLLVAAIVIDVGSFWLGLQALSGGIESVWAVLGIVFGAIAIGCAAVARWRIGLVRKHVPAIAAEVRSLVASGKGEELTVIDVFEDGTSSPTTIGASRTVVGMRGLSGQTLSGSVKLAHAVHAITSFPWLAFVTVAITSVFAFMAFIFLIALAL